MSILFPSVSLFVTALIAFTGGFQESTLFVVACIQTQVPLGLVNLNGKV